MSIVITGDTHGTFDIEKVVRYFNEHEDEYTRDVFEFVFIICSPVRENNVGISDFNELTVDYTPGKQETAREDFNNSRNYV